MKFFLSHISFLWIMEQKTSAEGYFGFKVYICNSWMSFNERLRIYSVNLKSLEGWKAFKGIIPLKSSNRFLYHHWKGKGFSIALLWGAILGQVGRTKVLCRVAVGPVANDICCLPRTCHEAVSGTAYVQKQSVFASTCFMNLFLLPSIFQWVMGRPHHREVLLSCCHLYII